MHPLEFLAEAKKGLQSFTAQKLVLQIFSNNKLRYTDYRYDIIAQFQ